MFGFDESQQADIFLLVQKLMEQAVTIVSHRSAALNRWRGRRRLTPRQKAGDQKHCREQR
jgi:hypothetical protein